MTIAPWCTGVLPPIPPAQLNTHTGDEGATLLAQKLSGNGLLVTLDVGSNGIGDVGAAALAEGLKLNTTLQKIDLRCVCVGGGGGGL